jgi:hypothetical protein
MIKTGENEVTLPTPFEIRNSITVLIQELYIEWKKEICKRIWNLEFKGNIPIETLSLNDTAKTSRLSNNYLRTALSKLQDDLVNFGYEYKFSFDDVNEKNWTLDYILELPDNDDDEIDDEIDNEIDDEIDNDEMTTEIDDGN